MKKRLTIEDRILIEQLLKLNYKLKEIASILDCESSTVSREIKKRRITGKGDYKECEKYNLSITNPYELENINEKIRYFRLRESLYQEDVAKSIFYLAGDGACFVTGQVLCVDGGMVI